MNDWNDRNGLRLLVDPRSVYRPPYSPEEKAAARAGNFLPNDYTGVNHSFAAAAGGVISTANDLATWIRALVAGGRMLNAEYQRRWLDSLKPEDPSKPGQKYGYGISQVSWGRNTIYFHGGETPGYNSKISYDPTNQMTLIVWTNLAVSLNDQQTANTLWVKVLDHIYKMSPLATSAVGDHALVRIWHDGTMHHYRSEENVESRNRGNRLFNCPSLE